MIDADELKWLGETPRMAAYRVGANGRSAAEIGIAAAMARNASPVQGIAAMPATEVASNMTGTQRAQLGVALAKKGVSPAKPKASTSQSQDRVKFVANAVATDPACKGKAAIAIKMLADPDYANVSGSGIVKMIKAGASADTPSPHGAPHKTSAPAKATAPARASALAPKAASAAVWDKAIASMGKPPKLAASKASMGPWDTVIGRMSAPAR